MNSFKYILANKIKYLLCGKLNGHPEGFFWGVKGALPH